jgi:hypothetical protein
MPAKPVYRKHFDSWPLKGSKAPVFSFEDSSNISWISLPSPNLQKGSGYVADHVVKKAVRFYMHWESEMKARKS